MYKIFDLNKNFILENIDSLIELEDYVPFDFRVYGFQKERDDFLKSKSLLKTMREMDKLLDEKCKYYKNPINACNSIMIEWLDLHPEFERIISNEVYAHYKNIKQNKKYIEFIDLLYDVELPSEKKCGFLQNGVALVGMILQFNYLILKKKMKFLMNTEQLC